MVYVQKNTNAEDTTPSYELKTFNDEAKENELVSITVDEAHSLIGGNLNFDKEYIYNSEKNILEGPNNGSLVLSVYFDKVVYKVKANINGNETEFKYFYNQKLSDSENFKTFKEDYEKDQNNKGYIVTGWEDEKGNAITLDHAVIADIASLKPVGYWHSYSIEYNMSGNPSATLPSKDTYTANDETFELERLPKTNGKFFAGWYDNAEFTGESIKFIEKGTLGNKTFYAKWVETLLSLEAECDATINSLLSKLKTALEKGGGDLSLINQIRKYYYKEKSLKKSQYMNLIYENSK